MRPEAIAETRTGMMVERRWTEPWLLSTKAKEDDAARHAARAQLEYTTIRALRARKRREGLRP
jgi:hypothetical protein